MRNSENVFFRLTVFYFSPTVSTHDSPLYFTDRRSLLGLCFDRVSMSCVHSNCLELVDREEFTCVSSPDVPEGTRCGFVNGLSLDTIYLSGDSSICILLLIRGKFTWFLQHTFIILSLFELISDHFLCTSSLVSSAGVHQEFRYLINCIVIVINIVKSGYLLNYEC